MIYATTSTVHLPAIEDIERWRTIKALHYPPCLWLCSHTMSTAVILLETAVHRAFDVHTQKRTIPAFIQGFNPLILAIHKQITIIIDNYCSFDLMLSCIRKH